MESEPNDAPHQKEPFTIAGVTAQSIVDGYLSGAGARTTTALYPYNDYLNQVLLQVRGSPLTGAGQVDVAWLATLAATGSLTDLGSIAGKADYTAASPNIGKASSKQDAIAEAK